MTWVAVAVLAGVAAGFLVLALIGYAVAVMFSDGGRW